MIRSCFLWEVRFHGKNYAEAVRSIKRLGIDRIEIKAADGNHAFMEPAWSSFGRSQNCAPELINLLRENGIQVYGWGFNYGADPVGEGDIAAQQCIGLGLDGWIFDVEDQFFNYTNAAARMQSMLGTFRYTAARSDAGFSAFPCWHNPKNAAYIWKKKEVYQMAARYCDFWEPQAYWGAKWGTTAAQLPVDAILQHREIKDLPVIVAGRGWSDGAGKVSPEQVVEFVDAARENGAAGVSWWRSDLILKDPLVTAEISRIAP